MTQFPPVQGQPSGSSDSPGDERSGLLLSQDLIFTSKVTGTAAELGYLIRVANTGSQAKSIIDSHNPVVIFADLNAALLTAPSALADYQEWAGPDVWFVAFGSHVDVAALAAAKAAGCHVVLPRSRFAAELPAIIKRYLTEPARRDLSI
jgi:DNA-binding NtrC family response regulator